MAQLLEGARKLGWVLLNAFLRFIFVFINNCVAIPSYCLYCILLQPLRIMDSRYFWLIEGIMFKWMLAMVSQWGWVAGYTGKLPHNMLFLGSVVVETEDSYECKGYGGHKHYWSLAYMVQTGVVGSL